MTYHVLLNPRAGKDGAEQTKAKVKGYLGGNCEFYDIAEAGENYAAFFKKFAKDDVLVITGGDGTLNRFINDTDGLKLKNSVWYFAAGNGNDFWTDIGKTKGDAPICIDEYLKDLPTVTVNGKSYKFLNGVGYGIDGYCCEVGDKLKAEQKEVNYTSIAIKGLLFGFKPRNATVIVDGVSYYFKKAWIAPAMNGRFYGGGMMPTPAQDRLNGERTLSICVMHGKGKLKTLMAFPTIFKGEHVAKKMVKVLQGKTITVKFDSPCALQIDGETILNVSEYTVTSARAGKQETAA